MIAPTQTDFAGLFDMAGATASAVAKSQEQILREHMAHQYALAREELRAARAWGAPRTALLRAASQHRMSAHSSLHRLATLAAHAKAEPA